MSDGDAGAATSPPEGPAPAHILLVDDDDDFRSMFAASLTEDGLRVVEVPGGEAAIAALESVGRGRGARPDLIVLDLMMPRMNGLEILQRLRRNPQWSSIPVIVVTAVNDPMLTIRLDVPVAYKADIDVLRRAVHQQLAHASPSRSL